MPNRFPTEAANDPGTQDAPDGVATGDDGTLRGRARGMPGHHSRTSADSRTGEARPGKDINQAGFVRERDRDPGKD